MIIDNDIKIGQIWWDKHHKWSPETLDIFYLILSADKSEEDLYIYKTALIMFNKTIGCFGMRIEDRFQSFEIKQMELVGNVNNIMESVL